MRVNKKGNDGQSELFFAHEGKERKTEYDINKVMCCHCGNVGHYARECPNKKNYMHSTMTNDDDGDQRDDLGSEHVFHQSK